MFKSSCTEKHWSKYDSLGATPPRKNQCRQAYLVREQAGHSSGPSLVGASLPLQNRHSRVYPTPRSDPVACLKNLRVLLKKELGNFFFFFLFFFLLVLALTVVLVIEEGVVVVKLYSLTSRLASTYQHNNNQAGGGHVLHALYGRCTIGHVGILVSTRQRLPMAPPPCRPSCQSCPKSEFFLYPTPYPIGCYDKTGGGGEGCMECSGLILRTIEEQLWITVASYRRSSARAHIRPTGWDNKSMSPLGTQTRIRLSLLMHTLRNPQLLCASSSKGFPKHSHKVRKLLYTVETSTAHSDKEYVRVAAIHKLVA